MYYDKEGDVPDPQKVQTSRQSSPQKTKPFSKEFGKVTYMFPFIQNMSYNIANLRELFKKDSSFHGRHHTSRFFKKSKN